MQRLSIITLFLLFLFTGQSYGTVIVIDKVVGYKYTNDFPLVALCDSTGNRTLDNVADFLSSATTGRSSTTVIVPKKPLPNNVFVGLLTDTKGGYVSISSRCDIDTLHIRQWNVLQNTVPDTARMTKTFFDPNNDTVVSKKVASRSVLTHGKVRIISQLNITINDQHYTYPLLLRTHKQITTGAGNTAGGKGKKEQLFHIYRVTSVVCYTGTVDFKDCR